jgi:hypothetical protein
MMTLFAIENDFTVAATAICALLLVRFFQLGLHRQFPWIVSYQFLQLSPTAAAAILGTGSVLYARVFEYACLPGLIATLFVAHELMSHLYAKYPGLRVFNQRSVRLGLVMSLVVAIPSAYSTHARWHDPEFTCMLWVWMEGMRITETGVIVYILNLLWSSKKQKVPFSRNFSLLVTAILLTLVSDAAASTISSALRLHGMAVYVLNVASLATSIIVDAVLILFLQRESALEPTAVTLDQTVSLRLNALQQLVTMCTRSLLR